MGQLKTRAANLVLKELQAPQLSFFNLQSNALFLDKFLKENLPKVQYRVPEATYLAWLDFRAYGFSTQQLKTLIHQKGKATTDDGTMFGPNGEGDGFHRLNFACPRGLLEKALNQVAYANQLF